MCVYWKVDDAIKNKMSIPNVLSYGVTVHDYPIFVNETACDFLHRAITSYLNHGELSTDKIQDTELVFKSDLKEMTYSHYLDNQSRCFILK